MGEVIPLKVVEKARKKAQKPPPVPYQWLCRRCKNDIGVASSEIMQTTIAPLIKGVRITGGTKRWICAPCNRRGIITEVF